MMETGPQNSGALAVVVGAIGVLILLEFALPGGISGPTRPRPYPYRFASHQPKITKTMATTTT